MIGRKRREDEFEEEPTEKLRPMERHNFCLIGVVPEQILAIGELFDHSDRDRLVKELREEAGLPWAKSFEDMWETSEAEARQRGLFDLMWHRRALAIDPVVNAPDFTGFDVLLNVARQATPDLAQMLARIDGNDASNPRRIEGPDWWQTWHRATSTPSAGWLTWEEAQQIHDQWYKLANPEIEEACLTIMGVAYTHPGCWGLMEEFGGFFGQCASERRSVVAEVDL